jgi:hypothetical protein
VSIHADDEYSLRNALEHDLDHVMPREGLAALVIARHRRIRRRRVAGAVGLVVVIAGIGIPLGLTSSGGSRPAHLGPGGLPDHRVTLQLAPYTLTLAGDYRPAGPGQAACATAAPAGGTETAAVAPSGDCVLMLLTASFAAKAPGPEGDPYVPRTAREVSAGRYQGWLIPQPRAGATFVIELPSADGRLRDLVISSSGLSPTALVSLVSAHLS